MAFLALTCRITKSQIVIPKVIYGHLENGIWKNWDMMVWIIYWWLMKINQLMHNVFSPSRFRGKTNPFYSMDAPWYFLLLSKTCWIQLLFLKGNDCWSAWSKGFWLGSDLSTRWLLANLRRDAEGGEKCNLPSLPSLAEIEWIFTRSSGTIWILKMEHNKTVQQ